jgi:hypothetical protein
MCPLCNLLVNLDTFPLLETELVINSKIHILGQGIPLKDLIHQFQSLSNLQLLDVRGNPVFFTYYGGFLTKTGNFSQVSDFTKIFSYGNSVMMSEEDQLLAAAQKFPREFELVCVYDTFTLNRFNNIAHFGRKMYIL